MQRAAGSPGSPGVGHEALGEYRLIGAGTGDDHIGSGHGLGEPVETDGDAVHAFGERGPTVCGTVGDEDVRSTGAAKGDGHAFTHRAGADDECSPSHQVPDGFGDHLDRRMADRGGTAAIPVSFRARLPVASALRNS